MQNSIFKLRRGDGLNIHCETNHVHSCKAVVIIVHGFAEHLGRYEYVTEFLNKAGYCVYRFDNEGHGKSDGLTGHLDDFMKYINTTDLIVEKVKEDYPDKPIYMLGHSMGGFIAAIYGIEFPDKLNGQILSGAATALNPSIKGLTGAFIKLSNRIFPKLRIKNDLSLLISRDQDIVKKYQDDPMVFKKATAGLYHAFLVKGTEYLIRRTPDYKYPCLILHGEEDKIIDPKASQSFYNRIASNDKKLKIYPNLYHEIFNEFEKDSVLKDVTDWLDQRTGLF